MKKLFIPLAFFLVLGASLYAGPFGLDFGMTLEQVKSVATIDKQSPTLDSIIPYVHWITPAKKSSYFDTYMIEISPQFGLFEIIASGNIIESDEYGEKIRNEFNKVKDIISQTYGPPTNESDYLKSGSIWSEPCDWLTALRKGERVYKTSWSVDDGLSLPAPLGVISLGIHFLYDNECYLELDYQPTWFGDAVKDALNDAQKEEKSVF